jgi:hypothetical protein
MSRFVRRISRTLSLIRDSPATLPDGSVLRRQPSHLLHIRPNLGYGTVLTAACAVRAVVPLIIIIIIIIV